jgi:RNA polymerase sigma factor (sigma-70 family)
MVFFSTLLKLAQGMAWRFYRRWMRIPADEFLSAAGYAITYAASLFDPAHGVPFEAYAAMVVRHALIHAAHTWLRNHKAQTLSAIDAGDTDGDPIGIIGTEPDPATWMQDRDAVEAVRRQLPARWFDLLLLHHINGYSFEEIAQQAGLSRQRIQQMFIKAVRKVRRLLGHQFVS